MQDTRRIFVSVDLPQNIKDRLLSLQRPEIRWIKWMKPGNMHITLNFLGDVSDADIEQAKTVIQDIVPYYKPFNLLLDKTAAERDMLWILPRENQILSGLQAELKEKFHAARLGKKERRPYVPHILFAKSKSHGGKIGRPMTWQPDNLDPLEFAIDRINLYESELTPGAATHRLIQSFALENQK